jgi:hypothetical protein
MRLKIKSSSTGHNRSSVGNPTVPALVFPARRGTAAMTFMEVLIALLIVVMVFGAIINGYISSAIRGEWTGYSLAAQSMGLEAIEQARSAKWDTGINEVTNLAVFNPNYNSTTHTFTGYTTNVLDVPMKANSPILATNFISIRMFNENNDPNPNMPQLQMIRVDTVWPFVGWNGFAGTNRSSFVQTYYTNTVCTLIAPDNRNPLTLGATPPPQD